MARDWIDEGLRHRREREDQLRLATDRRLRQTGIIKEKAPTWMRRLVADIGAAVDEYRQTSGTAAEIEFEALPSGGFSVAKRTLPSVVLECRPDYEAHVVYCNMARTDTLESDVRESVFNLHFTVDDSGDVRLRDDTRIFHTVDEAVEFLLKPVLFPPVEHVQL